MAVDLKSVSLKILHVQHGFKMRKKRKNEIFLGSLCHVDFCGKLCGLGADSAGNVQGAASDNREPEDV